MFADRSLERRSSSSENSAGTGGTYTGTTYNGLRTLVSAGTFTNSAPDSHGIVTIKGSGHWVRGTGIYKNLRGKFGTPRRLVVTSGVLGGRVVDLRGVGLCPAIIAR
jgi:hypothetical protein